MELNSFLQFFSITSNTEKNPAILVIVTGHFDYDNHPFFLLP